MQGTSNAGYRERTGMPPAPVNYGNVHNRLYQQAIAKQRASKSSTRQLTAEPSLHNLRSRSQSREDLTQNRAQKPAQKQEESVPS